MDPGSYREEPFWNDLIFSHCTDPCIDHGGGGIPRFSGEFWTAAQREASPLHEISYRGCFKPQLPGFFITALTRRGDRVYDPFSGRGTTVIEAGLLGRGIVSNDANPLSRVLTEPRFSVPSEEHVASRLEEIPLEGGGRASLDLSMFYEERTEREIVALRRYLLQREANGESDPVDRWIRMVATSRLTGHSPGFFSVYTLPPNQAISPERQVLINARRGQRPAYRNVRALILRKTRSLARNLSAEQRENLNNAGATALFLTGDSGTTPGIPDEWVRLTVTSPPFLDTVQYARDNWLRCWFNGLDGAAMEQRLTMTRSLQEWGEAMGSTFRELFRVTAPGGYVAFEVGEIRKGRISLDDHVVPLGRAAGFAPLGIIVNLQKFTKTSHIWGIGNNNSGTNTNRIVLFKKEG